MAWSDRSSKSNYVVKCGGYMNCELNLSSFCFTILLGLIAFSSVCFLFCTALNGNSTCMFASRSVILPGLHRSYGLFLYFPFSKSYPRSYPLFQGFPRSFKDLLLFLRFLKIFAFPYDLIGSLGSPQYTSGGLSMFHMNI